MLTINKNVILTMLAALVSTMVVKFIFTGGLVLNPVSIIVSLVFLFLLMQVYLKGHQGKGAAEGIRFGLLIGFLIITYKLTTTTAVAIDNTVLHTLIEYLVAGVTIALVYKKE